MKKKYRLPISEIRDNAITKACSISEYINLICKKTGWNRSELSHYLGISRTSLYKIEHGKTLNFNFVSCLMIIDLYYRAKTIPDPQSKYKIRETIGGNNQHYNDNKASNSE